MSQHVIERGKDRYPPAFFRLANLKQVRLSFRLSKLLRDQRFMNQLLLQGGFLQLSKQPHKGAHSWANLLGKENFG